MSSVFQFIGGAADKIRQKISTTDPTVVAGASSFQTGVVWFQCTEIAGSTPNLSVEVFDADSGTSYYLRRAKPMVAREVVLFGEGLILSPNEFLRITAGTANQVDVVGISMLPDISH